MNVAVCYRSPSSTLTSADLTVSALEDLMRDFVRDAEAGAHEARGWPNTCYGVSKMGVRGTIDAHANDDAHNRKQ